MRYRARRHREMPSRPVRAKSSMRCGPGRVHPIQPKGPINSYEERSPLRVHCMWIATVGVSPAPLTGRERGLLISASEAHGFVDPVRLLYCH